LAAKTRYRRKKKDQLGKTTENRAGREAKVAPLTPRESFNWGRHSKNVQREHVQSHRIGSRQRGQVLEPKKSSTPSCSTHKVAHKTPSQGTGTGKTD